MGVIKGYDQTGGPVDTCVTSCADRVDGSEMRSVVSADASEMVVELV